MGTFAGSIHWFIDWSLDQLLIWLIDWLIDSLFECLFNWLFFFTENSDAAVLLEEYRTLMAGVYSNIAAVQLKSENYASVIDICTKALTFDPANVKALYRRGVAHARSGDVSLAKGDFLTALKFAPNDSALRNELHALGKTWMRVESCLQKKSRNHYVVDCSFVPSFWNLHPLSGEGKQFWGRYALRKSSYSQTERDDSVTGHFATTSFISLWFAIKRGHLECLGTTWITPPSNSKKWFSRWSTLYRTLCTCTGRLYNVQVERTHRIRTRVRLSPHLPVLSSDSRMVLFVKPPPRSRCAAENPTNPASTLIIWTLLAKAARNDTFCFQKKTQWYKVRTLSGFWTLCSLILFSKTSCQLFIPCQIWNCCKPFYD